MKKLVSLMFLVGCASLPPTPPDPDKAHNCETIKDEHGRTEYSFCVDKDVRSTNQKVLYWMHGLMDGVESWTKTKYAKTKPHMDALRAAMGSDHPTVVSISFGAGWLVTNEDSRVSTPKNATVKYITEVAIPSIERKYGLEGRDRMIMGISQGGFNTLQLCFRKPSMFKKCALINAFIPPCWPWLQLGNTCNPGLAGIFSNMFYITANFTEQLWVTHEPSFLAQSVDVSTLPPIYITSGVNDDFKLFSGNEKVAGILRLRNANVTWKPESNDHYKFDPVSLWNWLK